MNISYDSDNSIFSSPAALILISIFLLTIIILSYYYFKISHILREKKQMIEIQQSIIREKEHQITKEKEKQKKEKEANSRFLKILSHDLRNPITAVRGYMELIIKQYNSLSDDKKLLFLHEVFNSSEELSLMLTNILFLRRCRVKEIKNIPKTFDLSKSIQASIGLYSLIAKNQKISIENKIPEGIQIYADPGILDTINRNFISNAIKSAGKKGFIEFTVEEHDPYVCLNIRDNGNGIDKKKIKEILKPEKALTAEGNSIGSGLIVIREGIKLINGEISINLAPEESTTFSVKLPLSGKSK